ncbi:hypothetical protein THAOC_18458 [Thalassiosira oceanica]|uniref:G-protein coupled receptors family 2 profile 2 domain-containing protein n=1 Tax=Thalassiosira oceanica TaxID=159749 RepID=K0S871_THAOC|nr:hypothetical protein THAOC_18458 [Thalassiosira oceanica]|eukprot:EJK61104.1 hypothetical protein THAOC_18458 [Thalassiosira oceanica]
MADYSPLQKAMVRDPSEKSSASTRAFTAPSCRRLTSRLQPPGDRAEVLGFHLVLFVVVHRLLRAAQPEEARPCLPQAASWDEHQTPVYNISLAIYYLLVIVKGWKEKRIAKLEKYLHALPVLTGLGTGLAGLFLKLYNSAGWICWIAPGLPNHPGRHDPNYGIYRLAFMYAIAWFVICFLAVAMLVIYVSVLRQEKKLDKYLTASVKKKRTNSIKIRNQAFLYVGCMYMTWLFGSVFRMMQFAGKKPPPAIIVLFVLFFPLQGFFNMLGEILLACFTKIDFIELTLEQQHKVASRLRMSNPFNFRRGNKDELKSSKVASAVTNSTIGNSTIGNSTTEEAVAERPMTEAAISNVSWCAPEGLLEEAPEEAPREGHTDSPGEFEKDPELVVEGMEKDAIDELVEISRA